MNTHQTIAIQALGQMKGDDSARAKNRFAGYSHAQMQEHFGFSGKTCQQILDDFLDRDAKIDAAIDWVKNAKCW